MSFLLVWVVHLTKREHVRRGARVRLFASVDTVWQGILFMGAEIVMKNKNCHQRFRDGKMRCDAGFMSPLIGDMESNLTENEYPFLVGLL